MRHRASHLAVSVLLAALTTPAVATACKCAPRPLDAYVAAADAVFLGRATRVEESETEPRLRRVRFQLARAPYKGQIGETMEFATPLSSATCGVPVKVGEWFLVFASRQPDDAAQLWFNSCDGTRRFTGDARQPEQPFVDVAAAEVLTHLQALTSGYAAPSPPSGQPVLPLPGDPHAELRGLLALPALTAGPTPQRGLTLYRAPDTESAVLAEVSRLDELMTRELAGEQPAAVVAARRDGWYELTLRDGRRGWVPASDAGAFRDLAALLTNRLNYLTAEWDGWLWPSSGAGYPAKGPRSGNETPARIVGSETVGDTLWLQVEVLDRSPCDGPGERVVQGGWVPAFTPAGKLVAWYYARGC
jgi:hypothetical protein